MKKFLLLLISILSFSLLSVNNKVSAGYLDETFGKNISYVNQPMNTLFTPLSGYYTVDFDFYTLYVFEFVPNELSLEELIRAWSISSEHFIEFYDINTEEEYLYQPNEYVYPTNGRIGWFVDDGSILFVVADIVFEGSDINTVMNAIYENTYVGVWIFSEDSRYNDGYNDGYDIGYEKGRQDGYNEASKEFKENFSLKVDVWLVPAIIIVFAIGIFVTYRRGRDV